MRILILGASGFLGRHLLEHLLELGHEVEGWSRRPLAARDCLIAHTVDLCDPPSFEHLDGPWDGAVHLAGHSVPGQAWNAARVRENVAIAAHGLDHLARVAPGLRVVFLSSARVYADQTEPHREDERLGPTTLYGLSKELAEAWARFRARDLDVRIVRAFQHIGPCMPPGLLLSELFERCANGRGPIEMTGPDSTIDVLDVRDGVRGIAMLLGADVRSGQAWNLSSGVPRRVSELSRALCARLSVERELRFSPHARAPLVGLSGKLSAATGWLPEISLDQTLDWIAAAHTVTSRTGA